MKTQDQTLDNLISNFITYLQSLQRSTKTLEMYCWVFRKIKIYVELFAITFYNKEVENNFLEFTFGTLDYSQLSLTNRSFIRQVKVLTRFQETGTITMGPNKQPPKAFYGPIGLTINEFLLHKKTVYELQGNTLICYYTYLHNFFTFLKENIDSVEKIDPPIIFSYVQTLDPTKTGAMARTLQIVRGYLQFLFEHKYIAVNHSLLVPKGKTVEQRELPSTFSSEEIKILVHSVDRSSPKGKRDYAIILLAAKLGVRSSDIRYLQFNQIKWEQNIISYKQQKTGKNVNLPLLSEVGNAIIDYLKYGRPFSTNERVFLNASSPYLPLGRTAIGTMVKVRMQAAGLNCFNRRPGPHALRHSFAGALLRDKTSIPIISEALGHSNTDSTKAYLRIDKDTLLQCALDVPIVPFCFYTQKGGLSHG